MKKFERHTVFTAAYISGQLQIPKEFISKILQDLARNGILISKKGKGGGFSLAKDPSQIKLKTIFELLGKKKQLEKCVLGVNTKFCVPDECLICTSWTMFNKEMTYIINNHSLGSFSYKLENDFNN